MHSHQIKVNSENSCKIKKISKIILADISYKSIIYINLDHLKYFNNLFELNYPQNEIRLVIFKKLPSV
jgi:hypothetical protein